MRKLMKKSVWCLIVIFAAAMGCNGNGGGDEDADASEQPDIVADDIGVDHDVPDVEPDRGEDASDTADGADLPVDDTGDDVPPSSRIIVDPDNPQWLKYEGDGPFFMCGPGDPEDFLYRGSLNPDGTRYGDHAALIDKLAGTGANSIYMQAVRSHGGDGDSTHNPFIDHDPANGINGAVLDQWETWFDRMDANGIVIFFFFYDDSARVWDTGDSVGGDERTFLQTLVDRFEHFNHLIWVVAEEYQERFSAARVSNIASEIRAADDYDHPIAVHKLDGLDFSEFADDPNIDQFAIQYNVGSAAQLHDGMVTAWNGAGGKYNLNMSEASGYGTGVVARQKHWAVAMGGAYVMVLGWDVAGTPVEDLEACGRLKAFMESTNFNEMSPRDDLAEGGTQYVLASSGESYIVYASSLSGDIGLGYLAAGEYDFMWLDIPAGTTVNQNNVSVEEGAQSWSRPDEIGAELALYINASP